MKVEHQTGDKQKMDIYYVHTPVPYSVEENFEGYFQDHDDLSLAQLLQDQVSSHYHFELIFYKFQNSKKRRVLYIEVRFKMVVKWSQFGIFLLNVI